MSLFVHVRTGSLVLNELDSVLAHVAPLLLDVHACVLSFHLVGLGGSVFSFRKFEHFLVAGVDLHELDPVGHAGDHVASGFEAQKHVTC